MAVDSRYTFSLFSWFSRAARESGFMHESLTRTHAALAAQSFRDFEWIIGCGGHTPAIKKTMDDLGQSDFAVHFLDRQYSGEPAAVNEAVRRAGGRFFLILPDSVRLLPKALERMLSWWDTVPEEERSYFVSIAGAVAYQDGTPACSRLPASPFDSNHIEISTHYGITGSRIGFLSTAALREHPFPEIEGEEFAPLELVLNRIGTAALTRYVDEPFAVLDSPDDPGAGDIRRWIGSPRAAALYYNELSMQRLPLAHRIRACANYVRFAMHAGVIPDQIFRDSGKKVITFFMLWPGIFLYRRDLRRFG